MKMGTIAALSARDVAASAASQHSNFRCLSIHHDAWFTLGVDWTFERDHVRAALLAFWSFKISGQWLASNPARGQCNVTALFINEFFGDEILKTPLPEGDHFYNRIDGRRIDLPESQFETAVNYLDIESDRGEALACTSAAKYEALKASFARHFR